MPWRPHNRVCCREPCPTPKTELRAIPAAPPPKRHPYDQWSPDARALDLVGDKWTLLIIRDLAAGPRRFVELQRMLPGISTEQLRSRLNRMVADGLLTRQRYREVPPRVDYELTERSRELMPVIGALARWGYDWTWTPPRAGEEINVGAIFRIGPGLLEPPRRPRRRRRADRRGRRRRARAPLPGDVGDGSVEIAERAARRPSATVTGTSPPGSARSVPRRHGRPRVHGRPRARRRAARRLLGRRAPQRPGRLAAATCCRRRSSSPSMCGKCPAALPAKTWRLGARQPGLPSVGASSPPDGLQS